MNTNNSSIDIDSQTSQSKFKNSQFMRIVQIVSRVVTLVFIVALVWTIFEAAVNGNSLPIWAWLGVVALLAVAIGLAVMVIIYKGVAKQVGPFDYRPSSQVTGELKQEIAHVDTGKANRLGADIKMTEGVLHLTGGATGAMDADFIYDDADWKQPVVDYAVDEAGLGNLVVKQRATYRPAMRQGRSEWEIRLNRDLPTDLKVKFGAGKADLKLSGLALTGLRVESGVGELTLDLSGQWESSMKAFIKASIGDTSLRLPQEVGVRVQSAVSFGSINANGLTWDGKAYTNDLYGQAAATLDITIEGGMGKVNLEQTD